MKVNIGPYIPYIGPHQIAEFFVFWERNRFDDTPYTDKLSDLLDKIPGFRKFCNWIYTKRQRKVYVHIDNYDCWGMDNTLAIIIVPMLKKLKENKHGTPYTDDIDVPDNLKSTFAAPLTQEQIDTGFSDSNFEARWEWILNEMIWTFEQYLLESNGEEQFHSGTMDYQIIDGLMIRGPNDTYKCDREGIKSHRERMNNGRILFAKYYESLWD